MAVYEDDWYLLRDRLREAVGEPLAGQLMNHLPPGGWASVATKDDLEQGLAAVRSDMARMEERLRSDMELMEDRLRSDMARMEDRLRAEFATTTGTLIRWFAGLVVPTMIAGMSASAAVAATIAG